MIQCLCRVSGESLVRHGAPGAHTMPSRENTIRAHWGLEPRAHNRGLIGRPSWTRALCARRGLIGRASWTRASCAQRSLIGRPSCVYVVVRVSLYTRGCVSRVSACMHVDVHACVCVHVCMRVHLHVRACACVRTCMSPRVNVHVRACVRVCMCLRVNVHV